MAKSYISKLRSLIELFEQQQLNEAALPAFLELEANYKERIFVKGLDSAKQKIGSYSTKPFYISPKSPNLRGVKRGGIKPIGKTGRTKFASGAPHLTKYLGAGYSQLRQVTGRQNKYVDLNFSGASQQTIQVGLSENAVSLGFTDSSRQIILEAQEKRFGSQIFEPTKEEQEGLVNDIVAELQVEISKRL